MPPESSRSESSPQASGADTTTGQPEQPPAWIVSRLSLMMALQYGSLGLWAVTVNTYISANTGQAGSGAFGPGFIGIAASAGAIGAMLSPVLLGVVADRYFSTEKILAALHLVCAVCLWGMCQEVSQSFFYVALMLYFQAYVPTTTLTNSLSLRHLPKPVGQFALVRALGTGGWVIAGIVVGYCWPTVSGASIEHTLLPLKLGVGAHVVTALYCISLPRTPALGGTSTGWRALAGGAQLWRNRAFLVFILVSILAVAPSQFYNSFVNPFLNQTGFEHAAAKMSIGQFSEVLCMMALPLLLLRIGIKRLFLIGVLAWAARFFLFAYSQGDLAWLVYPALIVHGACFTFVYITGQLYADRLAARDSRAAAQGVHTLATSGIGHIGGAFAAQWAQSHYLTPAGVDPPPYNWHSFWLLPAVASLVTALVFALLFKESKTEPEVETEPQHA